MCCELEHMFDVIWNWPLNVTNSVRNVKNLLLCIFFIHSQSHIIISWVCAQYILHEDWDAAPTWSPKYINGFHVISSTLMPIHNQDTHVVLCMTCTCHICTSFWGQCITHKLQVVAADDEVEEIRIAVLTNIALMDSCHTPSWHKSILMDWCFRTSVSVNICDFNKMFE
jgi:hypothetical protein